MKKSPPKIVAIVEDDPSMVKGVARLLEVRGFGTEVYTSAEEYLNNFQSSRADCLLLDVNLGGISGIELRRRLGRAGVQLPVIFMTAIDSEDIRDAAMALGCVAYLHKPFLSDALV